MLEVGTGFHPELTGRENVFLNGAILGMTRQEIKGKFDEIVDFSGVERYIDTPVKRYSSGMYVRLAFGVAAHLEPEILIVDEVLAVGDAEFQKKAIGKMKDVSTKNGRTVLFVSHNMAAIKSLCNSGLIMQHGSVFLHDANIENVVGRYYESTQAAALNIPVNDRTDRDGDRSISIQSIDLMDTVGERQIESGKQIVFEIKYIATRTSFSAKLLIGMYNSNGDCILFLDSSTIENFPVILNEKGMIKIKISDEFGLPPGRYFINIAAIVNGVMGDYIQNALVFDVVEGLFYKGGRAPSGKGICYVQQEWTYSSLVNHPNKI